MERCGGARGLPLRNHHAPPAITTSSAASAAASGASAERFFGWGDFAAVRRLRLRGDAGLQRIDPDRLGDVLELGWAEIRHRQTEPPLHLAIGVLGQTDRAWRSDAFQPRGNIDTVAHQVAVAFLDDVAQMNADPEDDTAILGLAGIALDHALLHLDRAAHGVDHTSKFNETSIAGALDDAPVIAVIEGSIRSVCSTRSRDRVRSSSAPASRLYPTTSATRIAAIFRVSLNSEPPPPSRLAQRADQNRRSWCEML